MLEEEIDKLREKLNRTLELENESLGNAAILAISQKLDKLITEYYKEVLDSKLLKCL